MAITDLDDRPQLAPAVQSLLATLRRRIRQYVWLEGCAAAVAWLGMAFWATLVIDWFFEPPSPVRAALLGIVGFVLAAVVVRLIGRRAFVPITDSNAATVLERRFAELNDSLLTAVVLTGRAADHSELDRQMLAHTCRQAAHRIAGVDLKKVFNPRPLWLGGSAASLLVLSVALFALLFSDSFGVWTRRMLALSDELWPRYTRLSVDGFPDNVRKVAKGADLEVVVAADTTMPVVPDVVEIFYRTEGGGRRREPMERRGNPRGAAETSQEYAFTFRSVLADVHFDVVGGDDRHLRGLWIQTVDSPTISRMTLDCQLPAYIGRNPETLPVTGVMQVPMGSRVTVRASAASKELVRVDLSSIVGDRPVPAKVLDHRDLSADRLGFVYRLEPLLKDTTLLFTLTDGDGIKSREPVRLALVALGDQPPQLAVQLDGIGSALTPQARIPAVGRITDDYGIGQVWFEHVFDQQKPGTLPIAKLSDHPTEWKLPEAALEVGDLGLKPGQKLLLSVKAADLCDLGQGPNVAASERWLLDVVTAEQLRAMLEARELVLRQRFEQIKQEMTEIRDSLVRLEFTAAAASPADKKAGPPPKPAASPGSEPGDTEPADSPDRQRELGFLCVQGALTGCRKGAQEVLGVAEGFDDIRKQFVNNRIDTEELRNRLQSGIAEPLRTIGQQMYSELDRRLEELQARLDDLQLGPERRNRARQQADDILLAMQKVLDRMIALEDFNQALELLRNIIQSQDDLRALTQDRQKQKARELLHDSDAKRSKDAEPAAADKLALEEQRIADKYKHLEDVLLRMAELNAATDPRRSALLKKAVGQSKERLVGVRFQRIVDLLGKDQLSRAMENQAELDQDLRAILELLLSENREKSLKSEKERIREYLRRIGELIAQQNLIQGRTAAGDDPKRLAGDQANLAGKTGKLADDIRNSEEGKAEDKTARTESKEPKAEGKQADRESKPAEGDSKQAKGDGKQAKGEGRQGKSGAKQVKKSSKQAKLQGKQAKGEEKQTEGESKQAKGEGRQAEGESKQAEGEGREAQSEGKGSSDRQDQAQQQDQSGNPARRRLQAAQQRMKEAEDALRKAQAEPAGKKEEEARAELEKAKAALEEILRQLREEEIERMLTMLEARFRKMLQMQEEVYEGTLRLDKVPESERTHNHEVEASRLSGRETQIVVEIDKALAVLREDGSAVAFLEAAEQLRGDVQQVVQRLAQARVGKTTQDVELDIIDALKETIEALRKAQKEQQNKQRSRGQQPAGQPQDPPLVDTLAELRMIRALQMRVNTRTARYSKLVEGADGEQAESAELLDALRRLAERQQRIHRVAHDLQTGRNQ